MEINSSTSILEIGCGEGGNILPFMERGCRCVGVDLSKKKIELAKSIFSSHPNFHNVELITDDIYKIKRDDFKFDLIIMRDVIEHIFNQEKFMEEVKRFLNPNGIIFFAFPPWCNPFGGHQQIGHSIMSKIPFIHLLPKFIYKPLLYHFEGDFFIPEVNNTAANELMNIRNTRISIERFFRIINKSQFKINKKTLYLFNPNYEIKFKIKPVKVIPPFTVIPFLRNLWTTAVYCVVSI